MTTPPVREDVDSDSWAPIGWEADDLDFDEAPFGSVLGDPLMGSLLFDDSELDDPSPERRSEEGPDRRTREDRLAPDDGAASDSGARPDPTAALRARAEEQRRAMRREIPQDQRAAAPQPSGYGRARGGRPSAANGHLGPDGRRAARPARRTGPAPVPAPSTPYGGVPGRPAGYGGGPGAPPGYGGGPGRPAGYGGGPGLPPGYNGAQPMGGPVRPAAPAGPNPYAQPQPYVPTDRARRTRPARSGGVGAGSYLWWFILFLVVMVWSAIR